MARGRTARKERVPFGVPRKKLSLSPELEARLTADDKWWYWFNDVDHGEELRQALAGGYEYVTADGYDKTGDDQEKAGKRISKLVGTNKDGSPMHAFLMAIKNKWREEDKAKKEEQNIMVDEAILGGNTPGVQGHGVDAKYGGTYKKNISIK